MNECTNKMWYRNTVRYYSVLKSNKVLLQATTRINLEDTMLSETSQIFHDSTYMKCLVPSNS